jgi:hypothetical protein
MFISWIHIFYLRIRFILTIFSTIYNILCLIDKKYIILHMLNTFIEHFISNAAGI